ncbi:spermidine synthase [Nocardiopsis sp. YSL2]|uniref:spermidine synthase n=1 Tax=Nocardiopsis sp. YSL2 TaxID=2939492 RepID=UPI0026F46623|nr:spermidine synthase [Nocardiopsis sp. YSL2]
MSLRIQELGWRATPMGEISLRRRWDPAARADVYEIKLDDEFLMSSLFVAAEVEVARIALAALRSAGPPPEGGFDVAVGGLGLGHTALTVLEDDAVRSLVVVEALQEVIDWHEEKLIPAGETLSADPRCHLSQGDFFARAADPAGGLEPGSPGARYHAVVVDIDHSPRHLLNPAHAPFYEAEGTRRLAEHLRPGGVFTLWSNDPPDEAYMDVLRGEFTGVRAEVVSFPNPYQDRPATNTVYVASKPRE